MRPEAPVKGDKSPTRWRFGLHKPLDGDRQPGCFSLNIALTDWFW